MFTLFLIIRQLFLAKFNAKNPLDEIEIETQSHLLSMNKNIFRRGNSGHLEIFLVIIIAIMGALWFWHSSKNRPQTTNASYYRYPQYSASRSSSPSSVSFDSPYPEKINTTLLCVAGGLIYIIGIMTGLFLPLLHSLKHKHHKVPFSLSCILPTKANRAMNFLDGLQKMRDTGLISKQEYESKKLEFLSKL